MLPLALGLGIALIPTPDGLTPNAWYFGALFVAVVAAQITEPLPGPMIGLIGVTTVASCASSPPSRPSRFAGP